MRARSVFVILLLVLAGISAAGAWWLPAGEGWALGQQRFWRRLVYRFGGTLPGTPDLAKLPDRLAARNLTAGAPVLIRVFKEEFELELWMAREGRFHHFATYPICRWSGRLGPKLRTGDRQAPEGFYTVTASALNPDSRWHRSFNLGFPNLFDRAHRRTGSYLMVHGGCSSAGCYAMTNAVIDEIWALVTAAFGGGQKEIQVQIFPFRMTEANFRRHAGHSQETFWRQLKEGSDLFEARFLPPRTGVCQGRYVFEAPPPEGGITGPLMAAKCTAPPVRDGRAGKGSAPG